MEEEEKKNRNAYSYSTEFNEAFEIKLIREKEDFLGIQIIEEKEQKSFKSSFNLSCLENYYNLFKGFRKISEVFYFIKDLIFEKRFTVEISEDQSYVNLALKITNNLVINIEVFEENIPEVEVKIMIE